MRALYQNAATLTMQVYRHEDSRGVQQQCEATASLYLHSSIEQRPVEPSIITVPQCQDTDWHPVRATVHGLVHDHEWDQTAHSY